MIATAATTCEHDDYARHGAEPDVGIALPYFECNDCGEYTMDVDEDYDEESNVAFLIPVWEGHDEDE